MNGEMKKQLITEEVLKGKKYAYAIFPHNGEIVCCTKLNKLRCVGEFISISGQTNFSHGFSEKHLENFEFYINAEDTDQVQFYFMITGDKVITDETDDISGFVCFVVEISNENHAIICLSINNTRKQRIARCICCNKKEYLNFILTTCGIIERLNGGIA